MCIGYWTYIILIKLAYLGLFYVRHFYTTSVYAFAKRCQPNRCAQACKLIIKTYLLGVFMLFGRTEIYSTVIGYRLLFSKSALQCLRKSQTFKHVRECTIILRGLFSFYYLILCNGISLMGGDVWVIFMTAEFSVLFFKPYTSCDAKYIRAMRT